MNRSKVQQYHSIFPDYHHHLVALCDLELPHVTAESQKLIHTVTAEALRLPLGDLYCPKGQHEHEHEGLLTLDELGLMDLVV